MTSGAGKHPRLRRGLAAVGSVLAIPLRLADAVLGVPHSPDGSRTVRELERLADLRQRGEITAEEHKRAKDRVLGS